MLIGEHPFSFEIRKNGNQSKDGRISFRWKGEKSGGWKCEEQKIRNKMCVHVSGPYMLRVATLALAQLWHAGDTKMGYGEGRRGGQGSTA